MVPAPWGVSRLGPLGGNVPVFRGKWVYWEAQSVLLTLSLRFTVGAVNACGFFALGLLSALERVDMVPLSLLSG